MFVLGWMCYKCQHSKYPYEQRGLTSHSEQLCALCGITSPCVLIDVEKEGGDPIAYAKNRPDRGSGRSSNGVSINPLGSVYSHAELTHAHCGGGVSYDDTLGWTCDKCRASTLQGWLDDNLNPQPPAPLELEGKEGQA